MLAADSTSRLHMYNLVADRRTAQTHTPFNLKLHQTFTTHQTYSYTTEEPPGRTRDGSTQASKANIDQPSGRKNPSPDNQCPGRKARPSIPSSGFHQLPHPLVGSPHDVLMPWMMATLPGATPRKRNIIGAAQPPNHYHDLRHPRQEDQKRVMQSPQSRPSPTSSAETRPVPRPGTFTKSHKQHAHPHKTSPRKHPVMHFDGTAGVHFHIFIHR